MAKNKVNGTMGVWVEVCGVWGLRVIGIVDESQWNISVGLGLARGRTTSALGLDEQQDGGETFSSRNM